jgi:hypothetical protein
MTGNPQDPIREDPDLTGCGKTLCIHKIPLKSHGVPLADFFSPY